VAGEYTRFFEETGNIQHLKQAEKSLAKALEIAAVNRSSYLRALSRNYIAQHRFKEALPLAMSAREFGSGKKESQSLLFDIHMELGNFQLAERYLDSIKNMSDFGYLIRVAKWNDHKGDLETTIRFMEKAMKKAEFANNRTLKIWAYSNIADYYGHAGNIADSYRYYLKTLELDPGNAYAKKGIAWIIFSHEKNGKEALRILNAIERNYASPDHYLLKSEIAQYMGKDKDAAQYLDQYYNLVQDKAYGRMYTSHQVQFYIDETTNLNKALELALMEVNNRATPETYSLLAYAYFKKGEPEKAMEIVQEYVDGKTFEPAVQLRLYEIYRATGEIDRSVELEKAVTEARYELGPTAMTKIESLSRL
jgi:pentatricopeptide repeat protein